jgi:hypothetical protein
VTWHEHADAYATAKWPHAAAHTRAGIADALGTITPALATTAAGRPPGAALRAALYAHAYNLSRPAPPPGTETARALAWAEGHSLPLTGLTDPQVARRALDALTVRLDGRRAAATTITASGPSSTAPPDTPSSSGCCPPTPSTAQTAHPRPLEWPRTCYPSIRCRVKTAVCPPRVRARQAAQVSALRFCAPIHESPAEFSVVSRPVSAVI